MTTDNVSDSSDMPSGDAPSDARETAETQPGKPSRTRAKSTTPRRRSAAAKTVAKSSTKKRATARKVGVSTPRPVPPKYPRHSVERALRIPRVILEQNAGQPASPVEAAKFLGGRTASGEFNVEVSSAKKYGFLRSESGKLVLTDRAKRALRPQNESDEISALREGVTDAPEISDVYNFYRGEYLPDDEFFENALIERFKVPADKIRDFREVFKESLRSAQLIDESGDKPKLIDIGKEVDRPAARGSAASRKLPSNSPATDQSCFVIQPFSSPYGGYYETLFKPAIQKANLQPVRADDEIFGSGKIMDQVWRGIREAKVLLAELSTRNANVYYELGLAHALGKPVVLIAADGEDVPFDVQHIRVVYYDIKDPFWGEKLIDKVAENIQSAIRNPEEAVLEISGDLQAADCSSFTWTY